MWRDRKGQRPGVISGSFCKDTGFMGWLETATKMCVIFLLNYEKHRSCSMTPNTLRIGIQMCWNNALYFFFFLSFLWFKLETLHIQKNRRKKTMHFWNLKWETRVFLCIATDNQPNWLSNKLIRAQTVEDVLKDFMNAHLHYNTPPYWPSQPMHSWTITITDLNVVNSRLHNVP